MKRLSCAALALALSCASTAAAAANDYPSRPITMIVPFAAGGPTDVVGRLLAQYMGQALGQNVIVEDVTGAAASIGSGSHIASVYFEKITGARFLRHGEGIEQILRR